MTGQKPHFPYSVIRVQGKHNTLPVLAARDEMQFFFVPFGRLKVYTLESIEEIVSGETYFINAGIPYYIENMRNGYYERFAFGRECLEFYSGSPAEKAVERLFGEGGLTCRRFDGSEPWQERILEELRRLAVLEREKTEGSSTEHYSECYLECYSYEVLVRLSTICLFLQQNIAKIPQKSKRTRVINYRMQEFLQYIQTHYREEVKLEMIADAAGVSKAECLRCFKSTLKTTPYKYLMDYRLMKAASLLAGTDRQISEIAVLTGFGKPSYFGKCFKERFGCTPHAYRVKSKK